MYINKHNFKQLYYFYDNKNVKSFKSMSSLVIIIHLINNNENKIFSNVVWFH